MRSAALVPPAVALMPAIIELNGPFTPRRPLGVFANQNLHLPFFVFSFGFYFSSPPFLGGLCKKICMKISFFSLPVLGGFCLSTNMALQHLLPAEAQI
jgi:hypothetical protein